MSLNEEVVINRNIKAPQKHVFEAWIKPETIKGFMFPMPGTSISKASVDAKEGGEYSIVMTVGENNIPIHGKYNKVKKFQELEFTWLSDHVGQNSLINLMFTPISDNETSLTLRHIGFEDKQQKENHEGGWNAILNNLEELVAAVAA